MLTSTVVDDASYLQRLIRLAARLSAPSRDAGPCR
jgi:hypothetical protein